MNINEYEEKHNIPKGEITKVLNAQFPKFSKMLLSAVRHCDETGVILSPKAVKVLGEKYGTEEKEIKCHFAEVFASSGLTYKDLGVSANTIHKLKLAEANPTIKTVAKLCKALNCRIEDLYEI